MMHSESSHQFSVSSSCSQRTFVCLFLFFFANRRKERLLWPRKGPKHGKRQEVSHQGDVRVRIASVLVCVHVFIWISCGVVCTEYLELLLTD